MKKFALLLSIILTSIFINAQVIRFTVLGEDNISSHLKITKGKNPAGNDYGQTGILRIQTTSLKTIKVTGEMIVTNTCGGTKTRNFTVHLNAHPTLSGGLSSFTDVELLSLGETCKGKSLGSGEYDRIANVSYRNLQSAFVQEKQETSNESILPENSTTSRSEKRDMENKASTTTGNLKNTEQQQYQNQADAYLNKAQDKNQSAISQNLNLDLAKTSAVMAGNAQQVQEINRLQQEQNAASNQQMLQSGFELVNILDKLLNSKGSLKAQIRQQQKEEEMVNRRRAEEGDVYAMYMEGVYASSKKDYKQAEYWQKRAADSGYASSMHNLAFLYYLRLHNDSLAKYWFRKAAESGNIQSMHDLATIYYDKKFEDASKNSSCTERRIALSYYLAMDTLKYEYGEHKIDYPIINIPNIQKSIGDIYSECGLATNSERDNLAIAIYWYNKALNTYNNLNDESKTKYIKQAVKRVEDALIIAKKLLEKLNN